MCAFRRVGPPKVKAVSKIRRTRTQAYTDNWDNISRNTIAMAGNRCTRCGSPGSPTNKLRAHHIIQVARGGRTVPYMLKCLCDRCHELQPGHNHLKEQRTKLKPKTAKSVKRSK